VGLRVFAGWDPLTFDAGFHAPDLAAPVVGHRIAVDERSDEIEETLGDFGVARNRVLVSAGTPTSGPSVRSRPDTRRVIARAVPAPSGAARPDAKRRPSLVVSPIALTRRVASLSATSKSLAVVPSYTNTTSISDAYDISPRRADRGRSRERNGGLERLQRASMHASASVRARADRCQLTASDDIARRRAGARAA
jgi:hypothetical protein